MNIKWRPESLHVPCFNTGRNVNCSVYSPFSRSPPHDLIITVNYTRALEHLSMPSLRTGVYPMFELEQGDDISIQPDMSRLFNALPLPIQLYPGFHLFGTTFYSYRDTYRTPGDLAFGIPHYDRRLVLNVQALIPDPEATSSSNSDNTTATLRLTYRGGASMQPEYKIEREQSSNSVLSGFALLGGAW
ncbi:hypothetical protein AGABI2DRAFT_181703, partial [Agaricus bisporus var. bisporus H97]|uniref:hypothetical protein n=1 Tax=Agaricus bisporus var. bisporus (strain H97 / ATCC MYA-4626 / FGSC 10389) TaxID=936046 RepID=UPI00029F6006